VYILQGVLAVGAVGFVGLSIGQQCGCDIQNLAGKDKEKTAEEIYDFYKGSKKIASNKVRRNHRYIVVKT